MYNSNVETMEYYKDISKLFVIGRIWVEDFDAIYVNITLMERDVVCAVNIQECGAQLSRTQNILYIIYLTIVNFVINLCYYEFLRLIYAIMIPYIKYALNLL